jgi:hypothetical protein
LLGYKTDGLAFLLSFGPDPTYLGTCVVERFYQGFVVNAVAGQDQVYLGRNILFIVQGCGQRLN